MIALRFTLAPDFFNDFQLFGAERLFIQLLLLEARIKQRQALAKRYKVKK